LEFPGGWGFLENQNIERKVSSLIGISRGLGGGLAKNPFHGRGMGIFWTYTLYMYCFGKLVQDFNFANPLQKGIYQ